MTSPVRSLRDKHDPRLSMEELARRAGVSTQTVFRVETGRSVGSAETLRRLAAVLGVSMEDLLAHTAESTSVDEPPAPPVRTAA